MPQIWPRSNILGRIGIALGGSIVVSSNNNMHGQLLYLDTELQVAGLGGGGGWRKNPMVSACRDRWVFGLHSLGHCRSQVIGIVYMSEHYTCTYEIRPDLKFKVFSSCRNQ